MGTTVETLQSVCQSFKERVQTYVQFHKRNRKTLQHHLQLLELLEVPQLVESCTRNGFYDEAIELANFVNGLERRHLLANEVRVNTSPRTGGQWQVDSSGSAVVQTIVSEIQEILSGVTQSLLFQFTETSSLPQQLQMISVLRKMDSMTIDRFLSFEKFDSSAKNNSLKDSLTNHSTSSSTTSSQFGPREEIRAHFLQSAELKHQMDFLEAKNVWLQRNLDNSETSNGSGSAGSGLGLTTGQQSHHSHKLGAYGKAIEMIEVYRTSLFAVITQFNALFLDHQLQQPQLKSNSTNNNTSNSSTTNQLPSAKEKALFSSQTILRSWVIRQLEQFFSSLRTLLVLIDEGNSFRSIFEQVLFFASRLSSVGADFTTLAIPVFEEVVMERTKKELETTFTHFVTLVTYEKITFDTSVVGGLSATNTTTSGTSSSEGMKEQLIPLYHSQDSLPVTTDTDTASHNVKNNNMEDVAPPALLMKFPPLAFFLNNSLTLLNFFREFPLRTIFEAVAELFLSYFEKITVFLVENSNIVREKGNKYFGEGFMSSLGERGGVGSGKGKATGTTPATTGEKLDCLYAEALSFDLFPHLLVCLLISFRKISSSAVLRSYLSRVRGADHFMADLRVGKELLSLGSEGKGGSLASELEALWQSFSEAKLLQSSQFTGLTKTTPFRPKEFPTLVTAGNDLISKSSPINTFRDDNNNGTNDNNTSKTSTIEAEIIEKDEKDSTELPTRAAPVQSDETETRNEEENGDRGDETEDYK
jgi:hypothetical protein